MFQNINGLYFPGGDYILTIKSYFMRNAGYLLNKALEANDKGIYFPVWGTCLGL